MSRSNSYKTMKGKQIDIDLLRKRNEMTPAVGNMNVNARGDELGPGGEIIKTKEETLKEQQKQPIPDEDPLNKEEIKKENQTTEKDLTDDWNDNDVKTQNQDSIWVEDDEGNFVKNEENNG